MHFSELKPKNMDNRSMRKSKDTSLSNPSDKTGMSKSRRGSKKKTDTNNDVLVLGTTNTGKTVIQGDPSSEFDQILLKSESASSDEVTYNANNQKVTAEDINKEEEAIGGEPTPVADELDVYADEEIKNLAVLLEANTSLSADEAEKVIRDAKVEGKTKKETQALLVAKHDEKKAAEKEEELKTVPVTALASTATANSTETTNSTQTAVLEREPEPELEPVDEEEYAILYYNQKPKDFGAGSNWFLAAYALISIPLLYAINGVFNWISGIKLPDAAPSVGTFGYNKEIFLATGVIGFIAFVLGVLGLLTAKKYGYSIWRSVVTVVGVIAIAVAAYILFVQ
jgi:hypothetical protein